MANTAALDKLNGSYVEIQNSRHPGDDTVGISLKVKEDGQRLVHLNIGNGAPRDRHANLLPAEARAVAYALLSFAEQIPN